MRHWRWQRRDDEARWDQSCFAIASLRDEERLVQSILVQLNLVVLRIDPYKAILISQETLECKSGLPSHEGELEEQSGSNLSETDTELLRLGGETIVRLVEGSNTWFLEDLLGPYRSKGSGNKGDDFGGASKGV
jgi:hypothetical protein